MADQESIPRRANPDASRPRHSESDSPLVHAAVTMVRLYQRFLSPLLGRNCRFHPTCSQYYILSVRKHGFFRGSVKGVWRICRCNPFHRGGVDYP